MRLLSEQNAVKTGAGCETDSEITVQVKGSGNCETDSPSKG